MDFKVGEYNFIFTIDLLGDLPLAFSVNLNSVTFGYETSYSCKYACC